MAFALPPSGNGGRIFYVFFDKNHLFVLILKNGGTPPPYFQQNGGLPLYQNRHSVSIIISKDS